MRVEGQPVASNPQPRSERRIVVTQRFFDQATIDFLEAAGCECVLAQLPEGEADGNLSHDRLVELLDGAAGWIVGHARVTRRLLEALPDLQVISRRGVGYDRVDLAAAADCGKVVCIAVGGNHDTVADHAVALMLAIGHRFRETQARMIDGDWQILLGNDLFRKTVGIVGYGRIGRAVAQRLSGFEVDVLVTGGSSNDQSDGSVVVTLEELIDRSDYVTLHAPLTESTRHIMNRDSIARMKPGSFLINTARGGLVDDAALLDALTSGHLGGAGLDTYESEADADLAPITAQLLSLPNVIATPHSGASTYEGLARTNMVAAMCALAVLDGRDPPVDCVVADGRA